MRAFVVKNTLNLNYKGKIIMKKKNESKGKQNSITKQTIDVLYQAFIILYLALLFILSLVPLMFDFSNLLTAGKVIIIAGSALFFVLFVGAIIYMEIKILKRSNVKKSKKRGIRIAYICYAIFSIYLLLRYFNYNIWGTLGYVLFGAFCAFIAGAIYYLSSLFKYQLNYEKAPVILFIISIILLFIALILPSDNVQYARILVQVAIGIGYLLFIALFANQTLFSDDGEFSRKHRILKLIFCIAIPTIVLITFPFYIKWLGVSETNFDIFLNVYSSLVGGGLTLAGVAWTINKSVNDKKEDEIKKYKPTFNLAVGEGEIEISELPMNELEEDETFSFSDIDGQKYVLSNLCFSNTDFTSFYFCGLIINWNIIRLKRNVYIEKLEAYSINQDGMTFYYCDDIESMALILLDLLGNYYLAELKFEQNELELSNVSDSAETTTLKVIKQLKIVDIGLAERQKPSLNELFNDSEEDANYY